MNLSNLPDTLRLLHGDAVGAGPNKEFSGHTVRMLIERIAEEREYLIDVLHQACWQEEGTELDSMALSSYGHAIRHLTEQGILKLTMEASHRYVRAKYVGKDSSHA